MYALPCSHSDMKNFGVLGGYRTGINVRIHHASECRQ